MININNRYLPEEEIRQDNRPYMEYGACLDHVFNLSNINSFADLGCATGHLLLYAYNKGIRDLLGIEYFEWQKQAASHIIKCDIVIHDLRKELEINKRYDIVNISEVGEHIDPEYSQVLIDNIKKLAGGYVVTTWADKGGDPHGQHVNPLSYDEYSNLFLGNGFLYEKSLTEKFINYSRQYDNFYFWWRDSLRIWTV
jgi:hypothetical protein